MILNSFKRKPRQQIKAEVLRGLGEDTLEPLKTAEMFRLEHKHQQGIAALLSAGSGEEVAVKLGISPATVSKWRKRLKLIVVIETTTLGKRAIVKEHNGTG